MTKEKNKFIFKVKDFLHPANVTWKSPKATSHDAVVVLAVVVIAGIFLAVGDIALGAFMNLVL